MANFWDNDEVVELVVEPEVTVEAPKAETTGTNFWDKDTVVGLIDLATTPETPAPVSEDPDRQFLQSGVPMEDRVFEPEAVVLEEPVVDTASVDAHLLLQPLLLLQRMGHRLLLTKQYLLQAVSIV
jgi:hypothetical protein